MTDKLPRVTADEVIKALERAGFFLVRQSGSHRIYRNAEGKRVTVPYHAGRIIHSKLLKSILRDADLTVERFKELLKWMIAAVQSISFYRKGVWVKPTKSVEAANNATSTS